MALTRDDLLYLITALEALTSEWMVGVQAPQTAEDYTITSRGQALLHPAATQVVDGADPESLRRNLLARFAEMFERDRTEEVEVQPLASMLVDRLRDQLAKTL